MSDRRVSERLTVKLTSASEKQQQCVQMKRNLPESVIYCRSELCERIIGCERKLVSATELKINMQF